MTSYTEHRLQSAARKIAKLDDDMRFITAVVTWSTAFMALFALALFIKIWGEGVLL